MRSSELRNWLSPGQSSNEDPRKCMLIVPCQQWPAPHMRLPITVAAPINPFMSKGQKMTHILRARVRATVARAYASSSCVCLSSSGSFRNFCPRPPVRKPTFVCATTTIKAVMPAQEVTLREITCRLDCVTHALSPKSSTMRF